MVVVIATIFGYGKSVQTQSDHAKRLDDLEDAKQAHGEHLGRIDVALVRLEEYNRGFADATRLGTK